MLVILVTAQLSVAVGAVQLTAALQLAVGDTEIFAGQLANTGMVLSLTIILKEQVALLPEASIAV